MPDETIKDSNDKTEAINNVKTRSSEPTVKTDEFSTNVVKEKDPKIYCNNNNNALKTKCIDKSTEQLLGSTFLPNGTTENGLALRASARVIHKLRMDSATPNSPPTSILEGKKEDETPGTGKKKEEHKVNPKTPSQTKTAFRMTWKNEEKDMFFDALNEYGRDFESISTYINNKQKRKNSTDPFYKTKDQVRVLYYQFYQKVSKYLKFSDEVKKVPQELYALINYGEMRKKLIFINDKSFLKLRELVYKGSVTIRTKGKNIKIKTPSCRALRKLNQLEEWQEEIKLPHRIDVILRPANVDAWGKVQSLAHNPRIRTQVPLQRRVSSLLQTLQQRWRSNELRLQEKIMSLEKSTTSVTAKTKATKAHTFDIKKQVNEPLLCFAPPPEQPIHRPVVHLSEFLSSDSICLNSYEQRIGVSIKGESLCSNNVKRVRNDSGSGDKLATQSINNKSPEQKRPKLEIDIKPLTDNSGIDTNEEPDEKPSSIVARTNDLLLSPNSSSRDSNEQNPVLPLIDSNLDLMDFRSNDSADFNHPKLYAWNDLIEQATLSENEMKTDDSNDARISHTHNTIKKDTKTDVAVESVCDNGINEKKFEIVKIKKVKNRKKDVRKEATHFRPLISQQVLQEIREGWTLKNTGDLTFGDLYVMFGESSKLYLEYSWVQVKEIKNDSSDMKTDVKPEVHQRVASTESISMKLKQLLLVAQLQDKTKRRGTCVCGHICDHRKLNKTNNDLILSPQSNEGLFKHPNIPNRRAPMFNNMPEGNRSRLAKLYRPRTRPMFTGKQVIVQRLLPVQPGINHSYGVVTNNNENSPIPSTSKQNGASLPPESNKNSNNTCTVTIQTIDGEISQLLTAKMNQLSETKTPAELCNTDSFKSLMELSLPDIPSAKDLSDDDQEYVYPNTPLMSPMRILHEAPIDDGYGVEDVSLSSILGHLENACNLEHEQSDKVSVITEPSIDYIARFEDMTAELQNN